MHHTPLAPATVRAAPTFAAWVDNASVNALSALLNLYPATVTAAVPLSTAQFPVPGCLEGRDQPWCAYRIPLPICCQQLQDRGDSAAASSICILLLLAVGFTPPFL
jgi:hypothetical protein